MRDPEKSSPRLTWIIFAVCLSASAGRLATAGLHAAGVHVVDYIGFWGVLAVEAAFAVSALVALASSLRAAIRRRPALPAYAALLACALGWSLPVHGGLTRRIEQWNFQSRLARRAVIVELAGNGKLAPKRPGPCDCFYSDLPEGDAALSSGGEVLVSRHSDGFSVTFFVVRLGWFDDDNYSAFVFRSGGGMPKMDEEDTAHFTEVRRLQLHWFYVRHT